jgi:hypothetical protein
MDGLPGLDGFPGNSGSPGKSGHDGKVLFELKNSGLFINKNCGIKSLNLK